ncbi:AEC family transporter [Pluralibacter gergoviae]|uniref:AEC family transporter n=1 Tax=Pluralibacter gergoviae TaxID=61647 RepID=UPI0029068853|nr:AEC family transporter [Pluralibacter gergoviae]MDU4003377.1 AEC family transporter [Pluralibacter gergoviae]
MNELAIKVGTLFFISCLGFIYGMITKSNSKDIANLLIYVISPVVVVISIVQSPSTLSYFYFSIGAFIFCSALCLLGYLLSGLIWKDKVRNLFAFTAGTGNTGYFALPIVLSMFNESQIAIAIFIIIGVNLYEFSVGYFILEKGNARAVDVCKKTLKLPVLYAALLGFLIKYLGIGVNENILGILSNFKGAYSVLGMLLIGIVLSRSPKSTPDLKFLSVSLGWKHILVPAIATIFTFLPSEQFDVIFLMALSPLAGNTVVFSSNSGLHPEKAATAVLVSSLLAIFLIPFCLHLL